MAFNLGSIIVSLVAKTDGLKTGLASVQNFANQVEGATAHMQKSMAAAIDSSQKLAGILTVVVGSAAALGGVAVKSAADLQQTSDSFKVLIGNTDRANKLFGQLAAYANNTPFEFPEIAAAGKNLLGFGINEDLVMGKMRQLGDIAAVTGSPLKNLAVVFGQVTGAGRLQAENFNQLIDMGVPIGKMLKNVGVDTSKLQDIWASGGISLEVFNKAFEKAGQSGQFAFQGTTKLAETFNGRLSTLKDSVMEFGRRLLGVQVDPQLGLVVKPGGLFDSMSRMIPVITQKLSELEPKIMAAFGWMKNNAPIIVGAIVGGLVPAFAALGVSVWTALAPLIPFIAAGAAVGAIIKLMADKANVLQAVIIPLAAGIGAFAAAVLSTLVPSFVAWAAAAIPAAVATVAATWPVLAIGAAIGALVAIMVLAVQHWDTWGKSVVTFLGAAYPVVGVVGTLTQALFSNAMQAKQTADAKRDLARAMDEAKEASDRLKNAQYDEQGASLAVEQAQRSYNEAVRQYGPTSLEARQAAYNLEGANNRLKDANNAVKDAQNQVKDSSDKVANAQNNLNAKLDESKRKVNDSANSWSGLIGKIADYGAKLLNLPNANLLHNLHIPGFASGVRGFAGGLAMVGEHGPELISLPSGSNVYNTYETSKMVAGRVSTAGSGGGTQVTVNLDGANITSPLVADKYAEQIGDGIIRRLMGQTRINR